MENIQVQADKHAQPILSRKLKGSLEKSRKQNVPTDKVYKDKV